MDIDPSRRNKKPRLLLESERERLDEFIDSIHYSARYSDDKFEYRHVQLPKNMLKKIPSDYFDSSKGTLKLLWEEEWRALGITQVRSSPTDRLRVATRANVRILRVWDGNTTRCMNQNPTFYCSSWYLSIPTVFSPLTDPCLGVLSTTSLQWDNKLVTD